MKSGNVVLGVLAGIAVGAIAGILLAPAKGSRTRKRILRKGDDLYDELEDKFDEFCENLEDKYEQAKDRADQLTGKGRQKYADTKNGVKNAASDIRSAM